MSPSDMLERWRAGDEAAFGELLRLAEPRLRRLAARRVGRRLRAKFSARDAVQDCLLRAFECRDQFRGQTPRELLAWLASVLRSEIRASVRRFAGTAARDCRREAGGSDQAASPGTSPSQAADRTERRRLVEDGLSRLPADYADIVRLREWGGLTFDEIADRLGVTPGAAKGRYVRALVMLGPMLGAAA